MKLFEPGKIGSLSIKNRIVMAAMGAGGLIELDGRLSPRGIDYYAARAEGGVGMIITGIFWVDMEVEKHLTDSFFVVRPRLDSPVFLTRLEEMVNAVHAHGTRLCVQLTAGRGRIAAGSHQLAGEAVAPSPLPCFWPPHKKARELTVKEVEKLVKAFGIAAGIAKSAGADAVELHGHEGYMMDEFATALWNKRTDKYGGDLKGRLRFPLEIIETIRAEVGPDFPILYKMGACHYLEGGREIEESCEMAKLLQQAGIAAFEVDAGCYETFYWAHPPAYLPKGCLLDGIEAVKKAVDVPVIAVGKLGYPELAEEILKTGKADFIALARPLLADPEWPVKVMEGRLDDVRSCIGCHQGCLDRSLGGKYLSCAVNPMTGMERELALVPAQKRKSVLVIGGGPAGMEAARVAALRGHQVTLLEKNNKLGGNLIPASVPDFKSDLLCFMNYLINQVQKLGVDIKLMTEATAELVQEMKPDAVIIATGSTSLIPDITGDSEKAVTAVDVLLDRKGAGSDVVVVGGDLIGCETAVWLAQKGKKVAVVESLPEVLQDMAASSPNRMMLLKMLEERGVNILTDSRVSGTAGKSVTIQKNGKSQVLKADTIVAVGREAKRGLIGELEGKVPAIYAAGDCVEPRKILNAIWEGFHAARLI